MKKTQWKKVGSVGVDSGQLMVCDPCYIDSEWIRETVPAGHKPIVLTEKGKKMFPKHADKRWIFAYSSPAGYGKSRKKAITFSNYASIIKELGISANSGMDDGILEFDPAYNEKDESFSYSGACCASGSEDGAGVMKYVHGHAGVGISFRSGYGDGIYDVFAKKNDEGRIVAVKIIMGDENDE